MFCVSYESKSFIRKIYHPLAQYISLLQHELSSKIEYRSK